ncbi:MAG: tetratricopeptide repeat protein [Xanthomonadales bacterium]
MTQRRVGRHLAAAAACALLASCATLDFEPPPVPPLEGHARFDIERIEPLALSTEMKQFVAARLGGATRDPERAWRMAYAMLDPWMFPFEYDPRVTLTAREAFRTRRGNCLTFSNLFIAMAREAGMEAWYRAVEIPPEWSSVDDTLLVSMHVNAAIRDRGDVYVIDVSRRLDKPGDRVRTLSDREAEAQFYNNLGADALVAGELGLAHAYFRKAVETDPRRAYVWSNLGVVLRRNGQTTDAMRAYETALQLDPDSAVALNNLYTIYDEDGMTAQAAKLEARVERNRRRNPYYLHHLAELSAEQRDWAEAIAYSRRAIDLKEDEYRFHYTLAQMQFQAGDVAAARSNLAVARLLAPPSVDPDALTLPGELPRPSEG